VRSDSQGIVQDAFGRIEGSEGYQEERARLLLEARQRRADEWASASFWRRMRVKWEIEREVRARLERKFPRWALYAARGRS
jgi:hypothetical protein